VPEELNRTAQTIRTWAKKRQFSDCVGIVKLDCRRKEHRVQWAVILDSRGIGECNGVFAVLDSAHAAAERSGSWRTDSTRGRAVPARRLTACTNVPAVPRTGGRRHRLRLGGSEGSDPDPNPGDRLFELVRSRRDRLNAMALRLRSWSPTSRHAPAWRANTVVSRRGILQLMRRRATRQRTLLSLNSTGSVGCPVKCFWRKGALHTAWTRMT
jgi:hypothetical protein